MFSLPSRSVGPPLRGSGLRSVFVVLPEVAGTDASTIATEWAAALGSDPSALRVTRRERGVQRVDTSLAGVGLRIVRLSSEVDPFPLPGGGEAIARRASQARPFFFDGPGAAWDFFQRSTP